MQGSHLMKRKELHQLGSKSTDFYVRQLITVQYEVLTRFSNAMQHTFFKNIAFVCDLNWQSAVHIENMQMFIHCVLLCFDAYLNNQWWIQGG